jgi:hypothetical protein
LEVRILNDLGVNVITETWPQIRAECGAPGRFAAIVGLKTKKRQVACRIPNASMSKNRVLENERFVQKKEC